MDPNNSIAMAIELMGKMDIVASPQQEPVQSYPAKPVKMGRYGRISSITEEMQAKHDSQIADLRQELGLQPVSFQTVDFDIDFPPLHRTVVRPQPVEPNPAPMHSDTSMFNNQIASQPRSVSFQSPISYDSDRPPPYNAAARPQPAEPKFVPSLKYMAPQPDFDTLPFLPVSRHNLGTHLSNINIFNKPPEFNPSLSYSTPIIPGATQPQDESFGGSSTLQNSLLNQDFRRPQYQGFNGKVPSGISSVSRLQEVKDLMRAYLNLVEDLPTPTHNEGILNRQCWVILSRPITYDFETFVQPVERIVKHRLLAMNSAQSHLIDRDMLKLPGDLREDKGRMCPVIEWDKFSWETFKKEYLETAEDWDKWRRYREEIMTWEMCKDLGNGEQWLGPVDYLTAAYVIDGRNPGKSSG